MVGEWGEGYSKEGTLKQKDVEDRKMGSGE